MWFDDCGKDRLEAVVGLLHPGSEVLAVGGEEVVGGAVTAPTSAISKLAEVVPLAGVAAFGAGAVVVDQAPSLGATGDAGMQAEGGGTGDVDDVGTGRLVVRSRTLAGAGADVFAPSPGGTVRSHGVATGADGEAIGGQADGVLGVVRRVEVNNGLNVGAVELIEEDASIVGRIEDGGDDVCIGVVGAKVAVGEQPRDGVVAVGADGADDQREVVGAAGGGDLVETMAVDPNAAGRVPAPGGIPVTEAAAMAAGCSGRALAGAAAEAVGGSGQDRAIARDTELVQIGETAVRGASSDGGEDLLQGPLIAVAAAW